jgi:hypothetical protein
VCPEGMTCEWFADDDLFVVLGHQTGECGAGDPWGNPNPYCVPNP